MLNGSSCHKWKVWHTSWWELFCLMTYAAGFLSGTRRGFYRPVSVYITLLINNHFWTFQLEQNDHFSCLLFQIFILQLEGDNGQQVGLGPVWGRLLVAAAQNVGVDGGTSATSQPPAMVWPWKPDLVKLKVDVNVGIDDRWQQRQRRRRRWVILSTVNLCVATALK